jgi:hypothetical protein
MLAKKQKKKREERKVLFFYQHFCALQSPFSFLFPTSLAHTTHVGTSLPHWQKKKSPTGGGPVLHRPEKKLFDGWEMGGEKKKSAANWLWARHPPLYKNIRKEQVYIVHLSLFEMDCPKTSRFLFPPYVDNHHPHSEAKKKKKGEELPFIFILFFFFTLEMFSIRDSPFFPRKKRRKTLSFNSF